MPSIAVAQTVAVPGDVPANLAQHVQLVRLAAGDRPDVMVFPELSLTGYELDRARELAFSPDDPRLAPLLDAAHAAATTLVVGAPVRLDGRLHIGAFVLAPDRTVGLYTKHHLGAFPDAARCDGAVPPAEATVFAPGDRNPSVPLTDGMAAIAVCADTGRPSHAWNAAARGATVYLASMFVIPSDWEEESARLRACAVRHAMVVALANFGGPTGGLASAGRSSIWDANGAQLVTLGPEGAAVAVADPGGRRTCLRTLDGRSDAT